MEQSNHNWFATITANILLDKSLSSTSKLLIALISNLSNKKGYCFASNSYLAYCLGISERQVQALIQELESRKFLGRVIKLDSKGDFEYRALTVVGAINFVPHAENCIGVYAENRTTPHAENNTIITNNTVNNKEGNRGSPDFPKISPLIPSQYECEEYFNKQGQGALLSEKFYKYQKARAWRGVEDWRAAADYWIIGNKERSGEATSKVLPKRKTHA